MNENEIVTANLVCFSWWRHWLICRDVRVRWMSSWSYRRIVRPIEEVIREEWPLKRNSWPGPEMPADDFLVLRAYFPEMAIFLAGFKFLKSMKQALVIQRQQSKLASNKNGKLFCSNCPRRISSSCVTYLKYKQRVKGSAQDTYGKAELLNNLTFIYLFRPL